MYLAVGHVQVIVTVGEQANGHPPGWQSARRDAVEKAYTRERLQQAIEADRARWERTSRLCAPGRL